MYPDKAPQAQSKEQHEWFLDIVEKELRGTATEEEKAYLTSSLDTLRRWEQTLSVFTANAQDTLSRIKQQMLEEQQGFLDQGPRAKSAWFKRKVELEQKRKATNYFRSKVQNKKLYVKQLISEHTPTSLQNMLEDRYQISKGYRMAIDHVKDLVERQGFPLDMAFLLAERYAEQHTPDWAKDATQPHISQDDFNGFVERVLAQRNERRR